MNQKMKDFIVEKEYFPERLARRERPLILYGTGNGADKILDVLESRGIKADGIFASDGFVRDRSFRGFKVKSYDEIIDSFGEDITVLIAFGSDRPEVFETVESLDRRHDLIIPEVPLYGGELFDFDYYRRNSGRIEDLRAVLSDDISIDILADLINFRLSGKLKYLINTQSFSDSLTKLLPFRDVRSCLDGGAYKGDTLRVMIASFPNLSKAVCVEPDLRSFEKLSKFSETVDGIKIDLRNAVLSDENGSVTFNSSSGRGAGVNGRSRRASAVNIDRETIDSILGGSPVDYIKLDVEGDEAKALKGAERTIREFRPSLSVSLYHRTEDFMAIPEYILQLYPGYKLFFRRQKCIPMWDLDLFAVPES